MLTLSTALLLGLLLGARHAFEPDHLAALSTLIGAGRGPRHGTLLGAWWGLGHTTALLAVGCILAVLHTALPPALGAFFELIVAAMLIALGVMAILRSRRRDRLAPDAVTGRDDNPHPHLGLARRDHRGSFTLARRPLVVGLVHGLAGRGALAALAMEGMPTLVSRLAYIVMFGAGSMAAMAGLTGLAGWPLAHLGRTRGFSRWLAILSGGLSVGIGGWWGWSAFVGLLGD